MTCRLAGAKPLSRWVALTLISWGTTLISSVQHWSSEANWMKMWVESTLSISFSYTSSSYPIKPSLSSAQYVNACGSNVAFRVHDVISRERLPQMCDNTDTVRSAPIFRNFPNSAGLHDAHEMFCTIHYLFPLSVWRAYSVAIIWLLRTQFLQLMNATLKMWGPVILIIVIKHTMNDSRSVRKCWLGIFCR